MLYGKIDRYILIAILAVAVLAVILIFLTRKENNEHHDSQDDLLLAMAEKLRVTPVIHESEVEEVKSKDTTAKGPQPTEEEEDAIIGIADKICFNQPLDDADKSLQKKFPTEVQKRLEQSRQILGNIINKFLAGSKDFDDYEKEYYETFQGPIDNIINFKKSIDAIALKISKGITGFSDEELQFQQNHPKQIEDALAEIKKNEEGKGGNGNDDGKEKGNAAGKGSEGLKGANPPLSADQRLKIILSIFEDGIPRNVTELATSYAEKAKVPFHKGNMSKIFGKLVDEGQLMCERFRNGKVYHGPPTWFENKKLKNHYKQNIKP